MLRHALKLTWNRKGKNALMIVELALAFLIVFFISAVAFHMASRWALPLGFQWENTYEVMNRSNSSWTEEDGATLQRLLATVRQQPEVEWAHLSFPAFRNWSWTTNVIHQDRELITSMNRMTDGAPEAFGVELLEGRFFDETDATPDRIPVLVNEDAAETLFPKGFVSGTDIRDHGDEGEVRPAYSVVGVFKDFRQRGELSAPGPYVIMRFPVEDLSMDSPTLQVRVREGTPVAFEERLQTLIEVEAPTWSVSINPLSRLRKSRIREVMIPLVVASWIALFLLLMVAFGLFGVLWQSVTRRTEELGLRRALGAHRQRVYRLIVLETLILTGLAVSLGSLAAIQFPIAAGFPVLDWTSSAAGMGMGLVVLMILAGLCSLYPAWLASRRSPAEALHYE